MIPHRRREFAAGNHFSFSHPPRAAADAMGEYNAWAERIKGANHGYFARSPDSNPGAWARRPDQIRGAGAAAAEEEFRWEAKESYDSDTPSPPLWKSPPIPRSSGSSPIRSVYLDDDGDDDDRGRNPNQRAQAIARYRQEMMEMVRGMPEAAYELSLRDIVESPSPRIARIEGQRSTDEAESPKEKSEKGASRSDKENKKEDKKEKKMKKKKVRRISRSESLDTGLLIKMFMPLSVGGRRKSFGASSAGTGAKVSPKPAAAAGEGNNKGEEWWNKNEFSEAEGSRTSSTNSSSSSGSSKSAPGPGSSSRSRSRRMSSCYSFFRSKKSRSRRS